MTRLLLIVFTVLLALPAFAAEKPLDPATVRAKIAALGVRDDTAAPGEDAYGWLYQRRTQVAPQLITGLDNPAPRIAEGCLDLLKDLPETPGLKAALLRIAGDVKHPLNAKATLELVRYADDPAAKALLARAATDAVRFPNVRDRATCATASGDKALAAELLAPLLAGNDDSLAVEIAKQLTELGHPSAIAPLEKVVDGTNWYRAQAALLALAMLDPARHALTDDQRTFINQAGAIFKGSMADYRKRWQALAALDRAQVRPFVMQALRYDRTRETALAVLGIWKDRAALPEIQALLEKGPRFQVAGAIGALLAIDDSLDAEMRITAKFISLQGDGLYDLRTVVRGIVEAPVPAERRLRLLRQAREQFGPKQPTLLAYALQSTDEDVYPLAEPLMREETDLQALSGYATLAAQDPQRRYAEPLARAVRLLAAAPAGAQGNNTDEILRAAGRYRLRGIDAELDTLFASAYVPMKQSAAEAMALCGHRRAEALAFLYGEIASTELGRRRLAAKHLAEIIPTAEERAAREAVLLAQAGKAGEDYALRLLPACGGTQTVKTLEPLLEVPDVRRAVHAAWVLAQFPDARVKTKALRRLALYAQFNCYIAQASEGISFLLAPELTFQQTIGSYMPIPANNTQPVQIPRELLAPVKLDAAEQAFAIRAYRALVLGSMGRSHMSPYWQPVGREDASYLPLLKVIAAEDPGLTALYVKGQPVAFFPARKQAAVLIAQLTGKPATYAGLNGEAIASHTYPALYPEQNTCIARYILGRMAAYLPKAAPEYDGEWERISRCNDLLRVLMNDFGVAVNPAFLAEATKMGLTERLQTVGVEWWRPRDDGEPPSIWSG